MKLPLLKNLQSGLKRARKNAKTAGNKKMTQKQLADSLGVTVESVRKWEQGNVRPPIDRMYDMCELYQCDMNYLTGVNDCTTQDIQGIHDYTGLSEQAIKEISIRNSEERTDQHKLDTLSLLLCNPDFWKILNGIDLLISNNVQQRIAIASGNDERIAETIQTDKIERFDDTDIFQSMIRQISSDEGLKQFKELFPDS